MHCTISFPFSPLSGSTVSTSKAHSKSWRNRSRLPPRLQRRATCQSPCCRAGRRQYRATRICGWSYLFHVFQVIRLSLASLIGLPGRQIRSSTLPLRRRRPGRRGECALLLRGRATERSAKHHPWSERTYVNADSKSSSNPKPFSAFPCA